MSAAPVIEVSNLHKSFGENHVLRDFSLILNQGENLAILGKSGSGKSVLIKCIINLITSEEGKIKVLNRYVDDLSQEDLDNILENFAIVFYIIEI